MMRNLRIALIFWIVCTPFLVVKAQSIASHQLRGAQTYVGSTPCDSFIHSLLEIKSANLCEFMKWELQMLRDKTDSFELTVYYGATKPNTNWFKDNGEKLELKGKYTVGTGSAVNPKAKLFRLQAGNLKSPILLVEMDPNIFHFADNDKRFIVGNAGYSYVLNKTTP